MGIEAPARVKYALIREAAERDGNMLNVSWMCRIAGVTRSGYYAWLDAAPARQSREEADQRDFANILEAYRFRGHCIPLMCSISGSINNPRQINHISCPQGHGIFFT